MADQSVTNKDVTKVVRQFLSEIQASQALRQLSETSHLDKDLGIGSLEKAELITRIEKKFDTKMSHKALTDAVTVADLARFLGTAPLSRSQQVREFSPVLDRANTDVSTANTLVEVLFTYAQNEPHRPHVYLQDEEGIESTITYGLLFDKAMAVAKGLVHYGLKPQNTVAIMLPTSKEFFYAYFGVMLAGGIPVPIYPPPRADKIEEYIRREAKILQNAGAYILITFGKATSLSKLLQNFISSLSRVTTVEELSKADIKLPALNISGEDGAMIQYTSGSTNVPKGVYLKHRNLLANIRSATQALQLSQADVGVSWLPLYHDMGLIGAWLGSLYYGTPVTIMSPLTFLTRPERWLWAIHYHRATYSGGPNFGYERCIQKVDENAIQGLDLSSWRIAFNGAEAVHPGTIERFIKKFAPYGFKPESMLPVYGLAENCVAVAFPPMGRKPLIDTIYREPFELEGLAKPASEKEASKSQDVVHFPSCGKPIPEHEIRVVSKNNEPLPERQVGQLQFRGPSMMEGYYKNPEVTQQVFHDGWIDTGDYAYIADGELYVTGRRKDVIIKGGRNFYPEEVELLASEVPGVRKGCVVAFGLIDDRRGTEKFVLVAETRTTQKKLRRKMISEINDKISSSIGLPPDEVIIVDPRVIPKTSSGKLQRSQTKDMYIKKKLTKKKLPVQLQVTKIAIVGFMKRGMRIIKKIAKFFYTAYVALLSFIALIPTVLMLLVTTKKMFAKYMKFAVRILFLLMACPIKVTGQRHINAHSPMVYVANHTSYLDSLALIAVLPPKVIFVAKQELQKVPILKQVLLKMNHILVDRADMANSVDIVNRVNERIKQQFSIAIYPEGTFTESPGLRPFKMGAFKIAVDNKLPVCPITIIGLRHILRGDEKLLQPKGIKVIAAEPLNSKGENWQSISDLAQKTHDVIAKNCGEPILNLTTASIKPE